MEDDDEDEDDFGAFNEEVAASQKTELYLTAPDELRMDDPQTVELRLGFAEAALRALKVPVDKLKSVRLGAIPFVTVACGGRTGGRIEPKECIVLEMTSHQAREVALQHAKQKGEVMPLVSKKGRETVHIRVAAAGCTARLLEPSEANLFVEPREDQGVVWRVIADKPKFSFGSHTLRAKWLEGMLKQLRKWWKRNRVEQDITSLGVHVHYARTEQGKLVAVGLAFDLLVTQPPRVVPSFFTHDTAGCRFFWPFENVRRMPWAWQRAEGDGNMPQGKPSRRSLTGNQRAARNQAREAGQPDPVVVRQPSWADRAREVAAQNASVHGGSGGTGNAPSKPAEDRRGEVCTDKWRAKAMTHADQRVRMRYEELERVWGPAICSMALFHVAAYNSLVNSHGRSACCKHCKVGLPPCKLPTGQRLQMPWSGALPTCIFRSGVPEVEGQEAQGQGESSGNPRFREGVPARCEEDMWADASQEQMDAAAAAEVAMSDGEVAEGEAEVAEETPRKRSRGDGDTGADCEEDGNRGADQEEVDLETMLGLEGITDDLC